MKKIGLILTLLIALFSVFNIFTCKVYANEGDLSSGTILQEGRNFIDNGNSQTPIKWDEIKKNILPIAHILVAIATIVFMIVGMIMGIKYMISGADERAGIKQKLIWLIIAMVVVYGATGIYNIVVDIMQNITK